MSAASSIAKGNANRARIRQFFADNPNATQRRCAKELGISVTNLRRHLERMRDEGEAA